MAWVPTRLMAARRKLHAATGSKSDPVDAAAVAHAALAAPDLDRHRIDERVREPRVLVDLRADLVRRRTMVINQVKAYAHLWLDHTPGDLARASGLAALTAILDASDLGRHVHRVLAEMMGETADLNQRSRDQQTAIRELVTPLAPALLEITGTSHVSAAVLLAEIGDITRFTSSAELARYTGCAPIPVYSSDKERHRLHRVTEHRLAA